MAALSRSLPWLLVALCGCATTSQKSPEVAGKAAAAPAPESFGAVIPFVFQPPVQKPWGLRVARHRTLPAMGGAEGEPLHFDSEENTRLWANRLPNGNYVLDEALTSHAETRNGDPDDDPVLTALTGVPVGMEISAAGKFVSAVDPAKTVQAIGQNWPGGDRSFSKLPPEVFTRELERDWRFGAQVYFEKQVHVNEPVYSLLSVSLPQLPGKYVVVAERFEAPAPHGDGSQQVTSTQALFGRDDPRWALARAQLLPLMAQLGVPENEVLIHFQGEGGETIGLESLVVYSSSYSGEGVFPLSTARGTFPLKFQVEEVAGEIAAPPLPVDTRHTASR